MENLNQIEKNTTIIVFDKPISEKLSPNIRTEDMVSFLCLAMKSRFEMFVVKCLC